MYKEEKIDHAQPLLFRWAPWQNQKGSSSSFEKDPGWWYGDGSIRPVQQRPEAFFF